MLDISELLTYSTIRIECTLAGGARSTGTGFFFAFAKTEATHKPAIVTNKHVVRGAEEALLLFHESNPDGSPHPSSSCRIKVEDFSRCWIDHPDPDVDLCILPCAHILRDMESSGRKPFHAPLEPVLIPSKAEIDDLTAVEEILMIGYPNGIWDSANNQPIVRRGITATHPAKDYEGRREFMIDAACFPGSSGSPVVLYNNGSYPVRGGIAMGTRVKLLGILYAGPQHSARGDIVIETIPTVDRPVAISRIPNNLGLVIRSERLRDFEPILGP